MKKLMLIISMLIIILISGTSCSNFSESTKDYFPLSTGMKREYDMVYSNPFKSDKGKILMKIENTETINDKNYYKMTYVYSGLPGLESETYYIRVAEDGYYAMKKTNNTLSQEYLHIKLPLEVGISWQSFSPNGEIEYTVQGIETLELINKKYEDCLKVMFEIKGEGHGYVYFSKGIGIIKSFFQINSNDSFEYILIE
jgi:hypothetical protein